MFKLLRVPPATSRYPALSPAVTEIHWPPFQQNVGTVMICSQHNISYYIHNYSPSEDSTVYPGCPTVKDALWSHISRCTAKDPPILTPAFSNISWFNPRVGEGGFSKAQLQWLVGLLWWSHAGSQSTMTRKQTGQEKQRNLREIILLLYGILSLPLYTHTGKG